MRSWLRLIYRTLKVFVLFTSCTILFYYGMMWVNEEYQNYHRYDEPDGKAIEVSALPSEGGTTWFERLILFYLNGE